MRVGEWNFVYEPVLVGRDDALSLELALRQVGDLLPVDHGLLPDRGIETTDFRLPRFGYLIVVALRWPDRTAVVVRVMAL